MCAYVNGECKMNEIWGKSARRRKYEHYHFQETV